MTFFRCNALKNSYKNIDIYYTGYVITKYDDDDDDDDDDSVNPLYFIIGEADG